MPQVSVLVLVENGSKEAPARATPATRATRGRAQGREHKEVKEDDNDLYYDGAEKEDKYNN